MKAFKKHLFFVSCVLALAANLPLAKAQEKDSALGSPKLSPSGKEESLKPKDKAKVNLSGKEDAQRRKEGQSEPRTASDSSGSALDLKKLFKANLPLPAHRPIQAAQPDTVKHGEGK